MGVLFVEDSVAILVERAVGAGAPFGNGRYVRHGSLTAGVAAWRRRFFCVSLCPFACSSSAHARLDSDAPSLALSQETNKQAPGVGCLRQRISTQNFFNVFWGNKEASCERKQKA